MLELGPSHNVAILLSPAGRQVFEDSRDYTTSFTPAAHYIGDLDDRHARGVDGGVDLSRGFWACRI